MYPIELYHEDIILTWCDVYWGIAEGLLDRRLAKMVAEKWLTDHEEEDNPFIIELIIQENPDVLEILAAISKIVHDDTLLKNHKDHSLRKIRYLILCKLDATYTENEILLTKLEEVYSDFSYPQDLASFIPYMPSKDQDYDPSCHTKEENEQHLIDHFHLFLKQEHQLLTGKQ